MIDLRFYEIWREQIFVEKLINGIGTSILLMILGGIIGFIFGLALATARGSKIRFLRIPSATFIESVRNTPLIVQLFFVCFGLPMIFEYRWPFFASALLALCLNFSAYYAEIIRAGFDNVEYGQSEAARALGLGKNDILTYIVLPQALAKVYPSLVSQFVFLFLTTGIISEVGVEDLTWAGRYIADRNFRDFEVFIVLTIAYALLSVMFRGVLTATGQLVFPWYREK